MELAGILLVVCVLVVSPPSASAESGQLVLLNNYNYYNGVVMNYSDIELICAFEDQSLPDGPDFQLNGTDIKEEINVTYIANINIVEFILTPEKEGFFTCSYNGTSSYNPVGLAG